MSDLVEEQEQRNFSAPLLALPTSRKSSSHLRSFLLALRAGLNQLQLPWPRASRQPVDPARAGRSSHRSRRRESTFPSTAQGLLLLEMGLEVWPPPPSALPGPPTSTTGLQQRCSIQVRPLPTSSSTQTKRRIYCWGANYNVRTPHRPGGDHSLLSLLILLFDNPSHPVPPS